MKKYRKESWINPKIEIKSSEIHDKGMFAIKPIEKGEVVVIWGGIFVTKEEVEKLTATNIITMQLDDNLFSVEEPGEDPSYFMNHSCDPNVWMKDEVTIIARRNIKPGEEILIDYALIEGWEDLVTSWECICGSPLCRKKVTGKDWRIVELQERYKDHFIPLVNKRIAKQKSKK